MNIIVRTFSGSIITRPDTTWEKDSADVYLPEFVHKVTWTPVLAARLSRAGRSVAAKFASRYYDSVGYGILLYPEDMIGSGPESFAEASCLDHTTFIPGVLFQPVVLGVEGNFFKVAKNGEEIYSTDEGSRTMIENAISKATSRIYIRTGDLLAVELAERKPLTDSKEGDVRVTGTFAGNPLLDFKVIME
jgi:hypothetical protein